MEFITWYNQIFDTTNVFIKNNLVIVSLITAAVGAGLTAIANSANSWLTKFYDERKSFIETNQRIISLILEGWFILWALNLRGPSRQRLAFNKMGYIISEKEKQTIVFTFLRARQYLIDDHNKKDTQQVHEKCEEAVQKLESYDPILAYKLRGAHHFVLSLTQQLESKVGIVLDNPDSPIDERLQKFVDETKGFECETQLSIMESLAKFVAFKYAVFSYPLTCHYIWKKKAEYQRITESVFGLNESWLLIWSFQIANSLKSLSEKMNTRNWFGLKRLYSWCLSEIIKGIKAAKNIDYFGEH